MLTTLATISEVLPRSYVMFINRKSYKTETKLVGRDDEEGKFEVGDGVRIMRNGVLIPVEVEHCHRCHISREMTYAQQVNIFNTLNIQYT